VGQIRYGLCGQSPRRDEAPAEQDHPKKDLSRLNSDPMKVLAPAIVAAMTTINCTCPLLSSVARPPRAMAAPTVTARTAAYTARGANG
jgi:hypothetical protein